MKNAPKTTVTLAVTLSLFALGIGMLGCQPNVVTPNADKAAETTSGDAPSIAIQWTSDTDCAVCHVEQTASLEGELCSAGFHATNEGFTCGSCHDDASTLEKVHAGATTSSKMPSRLKETKVNADLCISCHDDGDEAYAAVASSDVWLTDSKGTKVNPHDVPTNSDHANLTCVSCHMGHGEIGYLESAKEYCLSCHHENVFECNTCH